MGVKAGSNRGMRRDLGSRVLGESGALRLISPTLVIPPDKVPALTLQVGLRVRRLGL